MGCVWKEILVPELDFIITFLPVHNLEEIFFFYLFQNLEIIFIYTLFIREMKWWEERFYLLIKCSSLSIYFC